jgi:hypothetical protein
MDLYFLEECGFTYLTNIGIMTTALWPVMQNNTFQQLARKLGSWAAGQPTPPGKTCGRGRAAENMLILTTARRHSSTNMNERKK